MGRGIALEAKERYPWLATELGRALRKQGNHVFPWSAEFLGSRGPVIVAFPVKPERDDYGRPGWMAMADLTLIERSAMELFDLSNRWDFQDIVLPRPGCGNGGLKWFSNQF